MKIYCLFDYLQVTEFNRLNLYPSLQSLKDEMEDYNIGDHIKLDILTYFLY